MVGVANNRGNSVVGRVDTVVGLSLSLTLSVVATVAVSTVVVGISLSLPLAVVAVGPVAQTVVAKTVANMAKTIAVAVVGIGISLRLGSGEGRKGKCQDSLHLSSATFCDKPSH